MGGLISASRTSRALLLQKLAVPTRLWPELQDRRRPTSTLAPPGLFDARLPAGTRGVLRKRTLLIVHRTPKCSHMKAEDQGNENLTFELSVGRPGLGSKGIMQGLSTDRRVKNDFRACSRALKDDSIEIHPHLSRSFVAVTQFYRASDPNISFTFFLFD